MSLSPLSDSENTTELDLFSNTVEARKENRKLCIIGGSSTGKSSLVLRLVRGQFFEYQESTIGAAFLTQIIPLKNKTENVIMKFEIWDTAGNEKYRSLAPMYYRGACGVIIVVDMTNLDSLESAKSWINEVQKSVMKSCKIMLLGNKIDLKSERKISRHKIRMFAESKGVIYMETSAKTSKNVKLVFENMGRLILGWKPIGLDVYDPLEAKEKALKCIGKSLIDKTYSKKYYDIEVTCVERTRLLL